MRRLSIVTLGMWLAMLFFARAADSTGTNSWKSDSPRQEIRPIFEFKAEAGPRRNGSLFIRADDREGLDGHWSKSFPVTGGQHYRFRALRRIENVPSPRRSTFARILWRDDRGQPISHDEPGANSYDPGKPPIAEPEYPPDR